jgi:hypothetical protein
VSLILPFTKEKRNPGKVKAKVTQCLNVSTRVPLPIELAPQLRGTPTVPGDALEMEVFGW